MMNFREANQVKWVGIRPGHNGEQIAKHHVAVNTTAIIHTVTSGKTFYLSSASYMIYYTGAGFAIMSVRDLSDVAVYHLGMGYKAANDPTITLPISFPQPLEIPAGYDIYLQSLAADLHVFGFIHGWEE